MNRILSCFVLLLFTVVPVFADSAPISNEEMREVEAFFNSYVDSANNYKDNLIHHYSQDAEIERIVIKPDGTKQSVIIPMKRYEKELKNGKKTARLVKYKNTYTNKKYEKLADNKFSIKTTRIPFRDKKGLNAEFIITKTPHGMKISKESMETNVQKFLSEK